MPKHTQPYFWKQTPFVRLIIPFIAGIILQFYCSIPVAAFIILIAVSIAVYTAFIMLQFAHQYRLSWLTGFSINLALVAMGALLVYSKDIRTNEEWIGNYKTDSVAVLATLEEPLVEKSKSYKAMASVDAINTNGEWKRVSGKALLYFGKDSGSKPFMTYGSQVLFSKPLQLIKNSGNPGGFNYSQYNAFQDIYHQVFLKSNEYQVLHTTNINGFKKWLFSVRDFVVDNLQKHIRGEREAGVAEALLIGYRDDLDKDLVQAYSNTGVVHIIAISGLHLGMIYVSLVWLMKPFRKTKWIRWVKPLVILGVLWLFTLIAGGVPSILRSAVMFSFILLGETFNRKSFIYNTLAVSAFTMLLISPYFLWDIGFQLSYAAVVSIIAFSKHVHNWFYVKNKILDFFWEMISVTLAAQTLTLPIILFAFHQFPNLFLLTNVFIVPLSSIILFAELALLCTSFIPGVITFVSFITSWLLRLMNNFIEGVNAFSFAVTDNIQISLAEALILYIVLISFSLWLLHKKKQAFFTGLIALLIFAIFDVTDRYSTHSQTKVIAYNIPQHEAIDFISGSRYAFIGDTILLQDDFLRNFHLKPSRTLHGVMPASNLNNLYVSLPFIEFYGRKILLIDKPYKFSSPNKIALDLIIVSHNPRVKISELNNSFSNAQYVFDGSNSAWKINQWKMECDSLHLAHAETQDSGAFEMKL